MHSFTAAEAASCSGPPKDHPAAVLYTARMRSRFAPRSWAMTASSWLREVGVRTPAESRSSTWSAAASCGGSGSSLQTSRTRPDSASARSSSVAISPAVCRLQITNTWTTPFASVSGGGGGSCTPQRAHSACIMAMRGHDHLEVAAAVRHSKRQRSVDRSTDRARQPVMHRTRRPADLLIPCPEVASLVRLHPAEPDRLGKATLPPLARTPSPPGACFRGGWADLPSRPRNCSTRHGRTVGSVHLRQERPPQPAAKSSCPHRSRTAFPGGRTDGSAQSWSRRARSSSNCGRPAACTRP